MGQRAGGPGCQAGPKQGLSLSHRYRHGCFLPAVRQAVPDAERPAAAHGGARRGAQLHLQRVQPHLPQPHRTQEAPALPHRYGSTTMGARGWGSRDVLLHRKKEIGGRKVICIKSVEVTEVAWI